MNWRGALTNAQQRVLALRDRYPTLNHVWQAVGRFTDSNSSRLAAALTYTTFLAFFPVALLGYAILGLLLRNFPDLAERVTAYLTDNLPGISVADITNASLPAGIIGLAGLLIIGVSWVSHLRDALWQIYGHQTTDSPKRFLIAKATDAVVLIGLGVLILTSVFASLFLSRLMSWLLGGDSDWRGWLVGVVVGIAFNVTVYIALLLGVPRWRPPIAAWWGPVLFGAVGSEALKQTASLVLSASNNPAYAAVATAVGLLLFFNFSYQLLFWCASLIATAPQAGTSKPAEVALAALAVEQRQPATTSS